MHSGYRQEIKYRISYAEKEMLIKRFSAFLRFDNHSNEQGFYTVRTLYFDDVKDTSFMLSITGAPEKWKYRIRMYNGDTSFIRLEKKSKKYSGSHKIGEKITVEQFEKILEGDYEFLLQSDSAFFKLCYAEFKSLNLKPKVLVQYLRHAFVCAQEDVRITIDSDVCTCSMPEAFLEKEAQFGNSALEDRQCVLEVKFTHFLPSYIPPLLGALDRNRIATSKYAIGRLKH